MEKHLKLEFSGDSGSAYHIELIQKGGRIILLCDCPGGQFQMVCKHRVRLFNGEPLLDCDESIYREAREVLRGSKLEKEYFKFSELEKAIIAQKKLLDKELKSQKKRFGRIMDEGV